MAPIRGTVSTATINGIPLPTCNWDTRPHFDGSPEAFALYWKHYHPNPWRNKRTRAKDNQLLRKIRRGWKPRTVTVDVLRLIEEARKPKQISEEPPLIIPAIPKPEDF